MVMALGTVSETLTLSPRPAYQQTTVYSQFELTDSRRHKQEVTLRPTLAPFRYADTAYLVLNNTHRRYVSRTYYRPRMQPKTFAETSYASPKTRQETFVSRLDAHPDQQKSWFKTCIEVKPQKFKSSVSYPDVMDISLQKDNNNVNKQNILVNGSPNSTSGEFNSLDENMNKRCPSFGEKPDPGASQVYIPKRKLFNRAELLDEISGSIILDYNNCNGVLNGH